MPPRGRPRGRPRGTGRAGAASARGGRASQPTTISAAEGGDVPSDVVEETAGAKPDNKDKPDSAASASAEVPVAAAPAPVRIQSSSARGASSSRARGVGGSSTASAPKFRPRAIRRTDAERERIAQEETRKQNIKLAEDQRLQRARSGRGRRARGRGDAMGRGGFGGRKTDTSTNAFFGNPGAVSSGFGTAGGSAFRLSFRDQSNRFNADMFHGPMGQFPDEGEHDAKEGAPSSAKPAASRKREILPMGILRREPPPKEVIVATTAEMEAKEKAAAASSSSSSSTSPTTRESSDDKVGNDDDEDDVVMEDDGKVWPGAPQNRKVKVKGENGEEVEVTEIDDKRLTETATRRELRDPPPASSASAQKNKDRGHQSREAEVRAEQRAMMLNEFGSRADSESRDGRMYLMQFPPIMPPLRPVPRSKTGSSAANPVKPEPVDDDLVTMDVGTTVDLTEDKDGAGPEGDGERAENGEREDDEDDLNPYPSAVGYVGKMKVHRSGKVTIDWGGIPFSVMPGIQTSFLTNAVLLEQFDQKTKPGEVSGRAYGMGKVMGRFVCRPILSDPKPWVVSPEELEAVRAEMREKEAALAQENARKVEEAAAARAA